MSKPNQQTDVPFTPEQIAAFKQWLAAQKEKQATEQSPKPHLKDRVFTYLFSDVENQIALYSALHPDEPIPTADEMVLVTLQSVVSTHPYNDLGLLVRGRVLILVEAQSTWSVNIVLRSLMYLARTWSDMLSCVGANLYGSKPVSIPKCESYVVFTGARENKPEWLSVKDIYFPDDDCHLDFKVQCIYKKDRGNDILQQYIAFANIWDDQSQKHDKDHQMDALRETIDICIKLDILKTFFMKRRAEIMDIYTVLFDQNEVTRRTNLEIWNEGREEGEKKGREEGEKKGREEGEKKGREEVALAMKNQQISLEVIAQCTGLTLEQIDDLTKGSN